MHERIHLINHHGKRFLVASGSLGQRRGRLRLSVKMIGNPDLGNDVEAA
jgi:hypothetical protein